MSSWYKLVRVFARIRHFISMLRWKVQQRKHALSPEAVHTTDKSVEVTDGLLRVSHIQSAEREVYKLAQQKYLAKEFSTLSKMKYEN